MLKKRFKDLIFVLQRCTYGTQEQFLVVLNRHISTLSISCCYLCVVYITVQLCYTSLLCILFVSYHPVICCWKFTITCTVCYHIYYLVVVVVLFMLEVLQPSCALLVYYYYYTKFIKQSFHLINMIKSALQ